jgi:uncharacterized protein DUF3786
MMHKGLWDRLVRLEPEACQRMAKCKYLCQSNSYVVKLLDSDYVVNLEKKKIFLSNACQEDEGAAFLPQLCILAYLINATGVALSGKLVTASKLDGGQFFFRGPHALPTRKLEQAFGQQPELLYKASSHLNPKRCDFGDASIEILTLPSVPLTFVIWAGEEEFAARATILFDQTATAYLPLDALLTAINLAVKSILEKL